MFTGNEKNKQKQKHFILLFDFIRISLNFFLSFLEIVFLLILFVGLSIPPRLDVAKLLKTRVKRWSVYFFLLRRLPQYFNFMHSTHFSTLLFKPVDPQETPYQFPYLSLYPSVPPPVIVQRVPHFTCLNEGPGGCS